MFVPFSYRLSAIICLENTVTCRLLALGLYIFLMIIIITFTFIATLPLLSNGALQQQVIFLQK